MKRRLRSSDQQLRDKPLDSRVRNAGSLAISVRSLTRSCQRRSRFGKPKACGMAISMSSLLAAWSHEGQIAEMNRCVGKQSLLSGYLNALTGRGVHVVTVNDYLARRDAEWMGQVHRFLGCLLVLSSRTCVPRSAGVTTTATSLTPPTQSWASITFATTWPPTSGGGQGNSSIALLTRLIDPYRRSPNSLIISVKWNVLKRNTCSAEVANALARS